MSGNKGHARERQVRKLLESEGWWTCRAAGSMGDADIVALKANSLNKPQAMILEVKANKSGGPYMNFRPVSRNELSGAARKAGAEAFLYYWPPNGELQRIPEGEWPQ